MKTVEIVKVTTGEALVQDYSQMLHAHSFHNSVPIMNDHEGIVDSTINVREMKIHRVWKMFGGVQSERLVAIHPDVAEVLLIPEIKDEVIKAEIDAQRLKVSQAVLREDRVRCEFKDYRTQVYNASLWSRIKYALTGRVSCILTAVPKPIEDKA